jgi:aspartyl-tRNA(Asn)/glutamyl-tRNA(Gln) amidotransferase subunit B
MKYIPVIGLEIHIELNTKSKMFCSCLNMSEAKDPNTNVCEVCLGHPGTLPVANEEAILKTIKTGISLNCEISRYSRFDRKNYFYPDLPKGYQISQYDKPLCKNGYLEIEGSKIRIRRIHLEEDTGRLIHHKGHSFVDFNRAGIPLMELVTEPDINSSLQASLFAQELQLVLRYLNVSNADMEKGQMRVEANVSLAIRNNKDIIMGTKVEIKNLNSFRSVERAIEYEIKRQEEILSSGRKILQETRGWDEFRGLTFSQRRKEEAHDYRYFPDPDLPPLVFSEDYISKIKSQIPELPWEKRARLSKEYGLPKNIVEILVQKKDLSGYYEAIMSELKSWLKDENVKIYDNYKKISQLCSNYLITDLQGLLKGKSVEDKDFLITPENFAEFIVLIYKGEISSKIAKEVLVEMFKTGADPSHIIEEKGLAQITNEAEIEILLKDVLIENKEAVEDFKKGKTTAFQFIIGQAMKKSRGKANPELLNKILNKILKEL